MCSMYNCKKYLRDQVVNNIYMALLINTAATLLAGGSSLPEWIRGCCTAFTINTVASILFPVEEFSNWFGEKLCKAKSGTFYDLVMQAVATNLVYVTIISFCMATLNTGINKTTLPAWWTTYPLLLVTGIVGSVLWAELIKNVTGNN